MKRTFLATIGLVAVLAVGVNSADAEMKLFLDAGGGDSLTITDGDSNDLDVRPGVILYFGSLGVWNLNVETGLSDPIIGPNRLHLNTINSSTAAGTLFVSLTDTDFTGSTLGIGPWHLESGIGGVTGGTVSANYFADSTNAEFGTEFGPTSTEDFGPGAFSSNSSFGSFTPTDPFSLTTEATITHMGAQVTSFDHALEMIPEPGATLLGIIGLGALGMLRRRVA